MFKSNKEKCALKYESTTNYYTFADIDVRVYSKGGDIVLIRNNNNTLPLQYIDIPKELIKDLYNTIFKEE